eukprot:1323210-Rhodomonas_salina.1
MVGMRIQKTVGQGQPANSAKRFEVMCSLSLARPSASPLSLLSRLSPLSSLPRLDAPARSLLTAVLSGTCGHAGDVVRP